MPARPAVFAALLSLAAAPAVAGGFETEVLAEINAVRADPGGYARELRRRQVRYDPAMRQEDPAAVEEAIDFLQAQPPLPPLVSDERLAAAARGHVERQGPRGEVGHGAPGALGRRLQAQGVFAGLLAESISYGQESPAAVVRQLVIDSGVPGRGHRKDLFGRAYQAAGVACGPHARWGAMCVIDYAGAILQR